MTHLRWKRRWWHFLANPQNVIHKVDFLNSNSAIILFFHLQRASTYKSFILQNITFVISCGRQHLRWLPVVSTSWYFCPCVIPSSWVWAGPNDLFLMKSLWGQWWNVTSKILLQKSMTSFSCVASLWLFSHSLMKQAALLWAALLRSPCGLRLASGQ